ncbi:uncharacterized protein LOC119109991 [Pollicipes pollicipes]|uniref:uncharacterized protein LOC119109991 n=1 Tax=Pollicipes pollicipes TaxID=41117 RepID=UPI001884C1F5|nr:uncharacterized protein LOC119109991 [Pollicipes pollicipes]
MRLVWGATAAVLLLSAVAGLSQSRLDGLQSELKSRSKRQLFGGSKRRQNQNLFPGKNGPSLIYQGLYIPDPRFNSFADGIITNMVADMRASSLDPVYFRLNSRGTVTAHDTRGRDNSANAAGISAAMTPKARMLSDPEAIPGEEQGDGFDAPEETAAEERPRPGGARRDKRQLPPSRTYSTALLEGLTNINRRGDVEVQVASNVTLVRGRWLLGPLVYRVNFYESRYATRSLATEIPPIQMDTVTQISYIGADMADFVLGCPLMASLRFLGNVTSADQDKANKALHNLFQFNSFLYKAGRDSFESASYARLPLYSSTRANDPLQPAAAACKRQRYIVDLNFKDAIRAYSELSVINVVASQVPEEVATERRSYPLVSLVSGMGGYISLLLGVSVLSLVDLLAAGLRWCAAALRRRPASGPADRIIEVQS